MANEQETAVVKQAPVSTDLLSTLSDRWGISAGNMTKVIKATIFRGDAAKASDEELVAFLQVCARYDLNPFLREIHAFVGRNGGVYPIVGVDGWANLANSNPAFDGVEFTDHLSPETGKLSAITCRVYLKSRSRPVEVTEYMEECFRETDPWKRWPRRMLRHKSFIQALRYAFGFSRLYDEDEADRIEDAVNGFDGSVDITPKVKKAVRAASEPVKAEPPTPEPTPEVPPKTPPSSDPDAGLFAEKEAAPPPEIPDKPKMTAREECWMLLVEMSGGEKGAGQKLKTLTGKTSMADLKDAQVNNMLQYLKGLKAKQG